MTHIRIRIWGLEYRLQGRYVNLIKKNKGKAGTALIIMNMNTVVSLTQGSL